MRIAVITGGPIPDDASVIVSCCDKVICADSGVDFCLKHGIVPDTVYGDLDSISEEGIDFVERGYENLVKKLTILGAKIRKQ